MKLGPGLEQIFFKEISSLILYNPFKKMIMYGLHIIARVLWLSLCSFNTVGRIGCDSVCVCMYMYTLRHKGYVHYHANYESHWQIQQSQVGRDSISRALFLRGSLLFEFLAVSVQTKKCRWWERWTGNRTVTHYYYYVFLGRQPRMSHR